MAMEVNELAIVWRMMLQLAAGLSCFWLAVTLWAYTYGLRKGYEQGWKDAVDALTEDELDDAEVI